MTRSFLGQNDNKVGYSMRQSLLALCFAACCGSVLGAEEVFDAVRRDDVQAVAAYFEQGHTRLPGLPQMAGYSLIHHAAHFDSKAVISFLLAKGVPADFTIDSQWRRTPLHLAAAASATNAIAILLDYGAEIDVRDEKGHTPLRYAYLYRRLDAMRILLERGADVRQRLVGGPLLLAQAGVDLESADADIVELLKSYGYRATEEEISERATGHTADIKRLLGELPDDISDRTTDTVPSVIFVEPDLETQRDSVSDVKTEP